MNIEILEILMAKNNIKSYFQLAKKIEFPYTTLLDLIHHKTDRLSSMELISNYFNVPLTTLIGETTYHYMIDEKNKIHQKLYLGTNQEINILSRSLLL